jgi:adenylylsulfate kinase-like enzyme
MIYWFTGQPAHGKTVLGKKLVNHLNGKNINKKVFHLDGDHLREITINKDYSEQGRINNIRNAQLICEYLHLNNCDVVVSLVAPYKWLRDELKERLGGDIKEIYVHTSESRERDHFKVEGYEPPTENFIDVDTTEDSPDISFVKLLKELSL